MHIDTRLAALNWDQIAADLDAQGWATTGSLLTNGERDHLIGLYDDDDGVFRSTVVMARHAFGRGEYRYFAQPLPELVSGLRAGLYERLLPIANNWRAALANDPFPPSYAEFLGRCHAAGQRRPTPLLLRYGPCDYNCLHQDLYGEWVFPLQAAFLLSNPLEFEGGEFVLSEQRPRMQSRVQVVPLAAGEAVIFAVNDRPVRGARGTYRVRMRHGVSQLRKGSRHTLGVILHDGA